MEIIFRAVDGQEFKTAPECVEYEKQFSAFEMWDKNGLTCNPESAQVVVFEHGNYEARERFINLCRNQDIACESIDETIDYDVYFWSGEQYQWVAIDEENIAALKAWLLK